MKILSNRFILGLISFLIFLYIRLVYLTSRWQIIGFDELRRKLENKQPVILAFWHGRLAMMSNFAPHPEQVFVMISRHGDGEFIARIISFFRLNLIRGSTNRSASHEKGAKNRGGFGALKDAISRLKDGHTVCITPDGPKGPRMRVSSAIVELAAHTGTPIYPITFSSSFAKIFKTWDRFMFPFPFGRATFICSDPVVVPEDADGATLEKYRNDVENRLNNITRRADEISGTTPVEPAQL